MKKAKMTFMAILASFAMAGAGAAVAFVANPSAISQEVRASEETATWTATNGGLGSGIGSGTIKDTENHSWSYTRTLSSGASYSGFTSDCIQLGKNGGVENLTLSTSAIPGTIKSVSVECSSYQGKHNVAISVGGTSYLAATATPSWTTVGAKSGTGTSSGEIVIAFTGGTRAMYIKSISVVYEESSSLGELQSITVGGAPSAKTLDTEWNLSGVTVTGNYEHGTADVKNLCDLEVAEAVPAITVDGSKTVQVTATLKDDATMTDTKALTANLTAIPLGCDQLYTADVGDEVTVIGKFLSSYAQTNHQATDGVFIGNGEYGVMIYGSNSSLEGVTTDTYLKATGTVVDYKGLRELAGTKPTFEIIPAGVAAPYCSAPQDYTLTGAETNYNLVSRQTLVRGTVASVSGTFAPDTDTTVTITLANSKSAKVFLKKNQGEVIDYSGLSTALTVGKEVTVKGILSIYNGFQVILPRLVEKDDDITAEVFCESLMEKTDVACKLVESARHDALVTVWSDLKNNTFARMTDVEIGKLKSAAANYGNTSESQLENAMGRYNYLTKKYSLDNFLERDVSGAPVASYLRVAEIANGNQATAITAVSIVVASLITVGAVFAIKRRKKAE